MSRTDMESAKLDLAWLLMGLTGTEPSDEQAFAEMCSNAEGFLEDFLEYWNGVGDDSDFNGWDRINFENVVGRKTP